MQKSISTALVEGSVSHCGEHTFLDNFLGKKIQMYRKGNQLKLLNIRKNKCNGVKHTNHVFFNYEFIIILKDSFGYVWQMVENSLF